MTKSTFDFFLKKFVIFFAALQWEIYLVWEFPNVFIFNIFLKKYSIKRTSLNSNKHRFSYT